jgi:elongation factor G
MQRINIALAGHTSVGKTTFLDTLLWDVGAADSLGTVDEGKSLSDYDEEEIKRKISIKSSVFTIDRDDTRTTVVDTPGSSDFTGEVVSSFYGVDSVLLLIDAVNGVEIETSKIWSRAKNMMLPVLVFINKIDKERADFKKVLVNIRENLGIRPFSVQIPVGSENGFRGVVDLVRMKAYLYDGGGKHGKEGDIPEELKDEAENLRNELIETAAESRDELTEKYLEGEEITEDEIIQGLRDMVIAGEAVPVLCGSCSLNRGIAEALDMISLLAPPSNFRKKLTVTDANDASREIELEESTNSPFTGLVFKTVIDQFAGKISYMRVFSGVLRSEEEVYNATLERKEKLSKLALPFGKSPRLLKGDAEEGDIVVLTKLPNAETGHTLCATDNQVLVAEMKLPNPVHSVAIRAKNKKEEDKLNAQIQRAAEEDISFHVDYNKETKQTVISGMGELQFNIVLSRIKEKLGIEFLTSTPLVAYRETIQAPSKASYKHKKQSGGHGQYGEVHLELEPLERGSGFEFVDKIVGGVIPKGYIPGVEKGVVEAMEEGVVAGYPVVDIRTNLVFGSYHDVDSSELSFKIAGRQAFKLAMEQAKPTLLEPIMDLSVYVSDQYTGDIMSDLNSKRGRVLGMDNLGGGIQKIRARVPQAELLKFSIELRSITSGTGSFEMEFSHYDPISGKIAEDVIAETSRRKEEEAREK